MIEASGQNGEDFFDSQQWQEEIVKAVESGNAMPTLLGMKNGTVRVAFERYLESISAQELQVLNANLRSAYSEMFQNLDQYLREQGWPRETKLDLLIGTLLAASSGTIALNEIQRPDGSMFNKFAIGISLVMSLGIVIKTFLDRMAPTSAHLKGSAKEKYEYMEQTYQHVLRLATATNGEFWKKLREEDRTRRPGA